MALRPMPRDAVRVRLAATLFGVGLLVACLLLAPTVASADPYTVRDVAVDVTAANAAAAREQAVVEAQRDALLRLVTRLSGRTGGIADVDPARLVQGIEVQEERTSAVRYVGRLAVRFSPQAIRQALGQAGIPFAETESRPVLVLPVGIQAGEPLLWDVRTAWREAWERAPLNDQLVPVLVPFGDLADVGDVTTAQAASADPAALSAIGRRYAAGTVAVVSIPLPDDATEPAGATTVTLTRVRVGDTDASEPITLAVPDGPDMLGRAVRAVTDALDEHWRSETIVAPGAQASMMLTTTFADVTQWVEVRRRLAGVPLVNRASVTALTRSAAELELHYRGDLERLRAALAQRRLVLNGEAGGGWTLSLAGAGP
jgi:hypothetical protein